MAWIGIAASVVGSMISSEMKSGAAEDASSAQQQSTEAAIKEQRRATEAALAEQRRQYDTTRTDLAPWRNVGGNAINKLSDLMGVSTRAPYAPNIKPRDDANFDAAAYLKNNPDVAADANFAANPLEHYTQFGRNEGRQAGGMTGGNFNAEAYLQANPDVAASGMDALEHYTKFGKAEGRQGTWQDMGSFDAEAYRQSNPDVAASGMNPFDHYQKYGRFEKRDMPLQGGGNAGDLTKKFTLADFWDDPVTKASYQSGLEQGTKALTNMVGARGGLKSGSTLKALARFGADYTGGQAAGSSARFYGDQDRTFNRLSSLAGTGQTATMGGAQLGQNNANNVGSMMTSSGNTIGNMLTSQGNARGAAAIAGSNARSDGMINAGNTISNWLNRNNSGGGGGAYQPYYTGYDSSGGSAYGKDGGLLVGPKHEDGGINLEAEGGEVLIPARIVKKKGVKFFERMMAENRRH